MITVMTGQVVDLFDRDFRELFAISEKLDLYKEFHIGPPATNTTATIRSKVGPKRPPLPATTSRFQVSLGDSRKADIQVPAHKYYNPKYLLAFGDVPRPTGSLQERGPKRGSVLAETPEELDPERPRLASSEKMDRLSPLPTEAPSEIFKTPNRAPQDKKGWLTFKRKFLRGKSSSKLSIDSLAGSRCPSPTAPSPTDENEDSFDVIVKSPSKPRGKKPSTLGRRTVSEQVVNTAHDNESKSGLKGYIKIESSNQILWFLYCGKEVSRQLAEFFFFRLQFIFFFIFRLA